ncbi:hypothetical protein LCGC14_2944870 [marine sediment metagenome]|uniref:Uncharacterized protein n=1 Tax=marine sediment metagenome TaxID=412755 RepID=A0A0F8Y431_9ZZZZ
MPHRPLFKTTVNDGHMHFWRPGTSFTTIQDGHNHKVSGGIALPNKPMAHVHRILL